MMSVAAILLGLITFLGGVGETVAQANVRVASVDDFDYQSWDSEYIVSLDDRGRSVVYVKETMVALFPEFDQNKGVIRSVPSELNSVRLGTKVLSITDELGDPVPYKKKKEDGWIYLLLGTEEYLHGPHTFVIEYEMRNALVPIKESGIDEFYWNLLPLDSTQDIANFHASVTFSSELVAAQTGNWACYEGRYGSTDPCAEDMVSASAGVFEFNSGPRVAGDGVTIAVGFNAGLIKQPIVRSTAPYFWGGSAIAFLFALVSAVGAGIAKLLMVVRSRKGTGIVVPQYDVPANLSPLIASVLLPKAKKPIAAQILYLAVNGILTISGVKTRKGNPTLKKVSGAKQLSPFDSRFEQSLFQGKSTVRIPSRSTTFASRMISMQKSAMDEALKRGLIEKRTSSASKKLFYLAASFVVVSVFVSAIALALGSTDGLMMTVLFATFGIVIFGFATASITQTVVLTASGAETYEYLRGVKLFIGVAEADRIRMLQSVSGVTSEVDDANAEETYGATAHLYEKLLPYAVLFGQEKSWGRVLEKTYKFASVSPVWLIGNTAQSFSTQLRHVTSSTQVSAGYGTSTSSGGGSIGGGFSGGGGGGGFSGGR